MIKNLGLLEADPTDQPPQIRPLLFDLEQILDGPTRQQLEVPESTGKLTSEIALISR